MIGLISLFIKINACVQCCYLLANIEKQNRKQRITNFLILQDIEIRDASPEKIQIFAMWGLRNTSKPLSGRAPLTSTRSQVM